MSVSYTCPNPACGVTLKTPNPIAPGKQVKCPKCSRMFAPVPEREAPAAGTFKFADDGGKKPKPEPAKPSTPEDKKKPEDDDEDAESVKKGYGVVKETEAELEEGVKHKVKFGAVEDKYVKSSRGPAIALLVLPSNLMIAAGLIAAVAGLFMFVIGMWPLVFNDAPPGDEETEEAIMKMLLGMMIFGWGGIICFGASQMQELKSYLWAMAGAVMAVAFLVGIYAVIMLQDPKVKAGFEESEGGPEDEDDLGKKKDDDDDDADDDDADDDD